VTSNPAIDRTFLIPGFSLGRIFRPDRLIVAAGGKGINVARALRVLGGESLCAGFLAGHNGRLLAELAEREGLQGGWTWIEGETRICSIIADPQGEATVINEKGPTAAAQDWERLRDDISAQASHADCVCFSGSMPPGAPPEVFADVLKALHKQGKTVWADTSGQSLQAVLAVRGMNIKVNGDEAGAVLGTVVSDPASASAAAQEIHDRVGGIVVLTLGKMGAVLANDDGCWWAQPPTLKVLSNVGSGDSFLAGLVQSLATGQTPDEALRRGVAAGTANALSIGGGSFSIDEFHRVLAGTQLQSV
jgi:1-phosphofructokinase family hexose kinase